MKLPQLKQIHKSYWYSLGAVLAVAAVWSLVIIPGLNRLQNTTQEILSGQSTQYSSADATAKLIAVLQRRQDLASNRVRLKSIFIDQNNPVVFISRIEELANIHHLTLDTNLEEPDDKLTSSLDLTVAGQFNDALAFYNDLTHEPTLLTINKVSLDTPTNTPGLISLTLEATSYWY
ncbi:MAG: hypothetical protein WCV88_00970 [Patescibacteria group bacterium]